MSPRGLDDALINRERVGARKPRRAHPPRTRDVSSAAPRSGGLEEWREEEAPGAEHQPQTSGISSDALFPRPAPPSSTSSSDSSMNNHIGNGTPPESSVNWTDSSAARSTAADLDRLSFHYGRHPSPVTRAGNAAGGAAAPSKRAGGNRSLKTTHFSAPGSRLPSAGQTQSSRHGINSHRHAARGSPKHAKHSTSPARRKALASPFLQDSANDTLPSSRMNLLRQCAPGMPADLSPPDPSPHLVLPNEMAHPAHTRYPGMIMQPDSSPISQDQLAAEIKGIYAGLVMVEAKCITIDTTQAADTTSELKPEDWQSLIALHRTLLYEHHDFLMATQHPSATMALRGLAIKYNMPARMWKHGIHAFLEVLRHRRPASQEYMLAFIYLAYQMMALLFETVPSFTDTWIECLGDLARYRMAIEEEKEAHATWGGVAARWYTIASDRHPSIGRLYHHLGILACPSLRKLCLYAKSLTTVIPFPNARDSFSTLCAPIVQNESTIESSCQSAEGCVVTLQALCYSDKAPQVIETVREKALRFIEQLQPAKLHEMGAHLAVANVAAVLQLGDANNVIWQLYHAAINQAIQSMRPSMSSEKVSIIDFGQLQQSLADWKPGNSFSSSIDFCYHSFNKITANHNPEALRASLPYVHVMLVWFHSLHSLRGRLNEHARHENTFGCLISTHPVNWSGLASFLNALLFQRPVSARVVECARQGVFLASEHKEDARPLAEDYLIRGLIWVQFYFTPGWFEGPEDDWRAIETPTMQEARADRVLWLSLYLAFHTQHLSYDAQNKTFSVPAAMGPSSTGLLMECQVAATDVDTISPSSEHVAVTGSLTPPSSWPEERSERSSLSEDGYTIVKSNPATTPSIQSARTARSSPSWVQVHHAGEPKTWSAGKAERQGTPSLQPAQTAQSRPPKVHDSKNKPQGRKKGSKHGAGVIKVAGEGEETDGEMGSGRTSFSYDRGCRFIA